MPKVSPTYTITVKNKEGEVVERRLVRAKNFAVARNHVTNQLIGVERSTDEELVALGKEGVVIEDAA